MRGGTSFRDLRTYEGKLYESYYDTAVAMGLVENDGEIFKMFEEACIVMLPKQLRSFFAWFLLADNIQGDKIWEKFKSFFCEGFQENAEDYALKHISDIFTAEDRSCTEFKLPEPNINNTTLSATQTVAYERIYKEMYKTLTKEQQIVLNKIINGPDHVFFIDGPGGSGKTYLYITLINYFLARNEKVLTMAWTGIAALLLPGGMTTHRTFHLPRNFQNIQSCALNSESEKRKLREADVIFIDEGSMLPKKALEIIHETLCDLCENQHPFGNKLVIMGGDFRQILPVLKYGSPTSIIEETIKYSYLWTNVTVLSLSANIRSIDLEYSKFFMKVGNGDS